MFSGIVEEIGYIDHVVAGDHALTFTIHAKTVLQDIKIGDSIAVNGVCLTVVSFDKKSFVVDIMPETFKATSLSELHAGSGVNLERALALGARIGGHFVTGHVDGIGTIKELTVESNAKNYVVELPDNLIRYCIYKGSIAVDGISLTIFGVENNQIKLAPIPHTVANTTLGAKSVGSIVNIEGDMLGKYIENFIAKKQPTS